MKPFDILSRVVQASKPRRGCGAAHGEERVPTSRTSSTSDQISFFDGEEFGRYEFDGFFTGHAFADFLLGVPRFTGYILPAPDVNPFATYYAFFAQDAWRPSPKLTIDVGLRYDLRPPMQDRTQPARQLRR